MKKLLFILLAMMTLCSCGNKKQDDSASKKTLVLYYSQTGATETVAKELQSQLGADIEEIYAINPYNGDFNATIARCQEEMTEGILPDIESIKSVLEDYDVIYLGYPIWFGKAAPPVLSFVKKYDLKGVKLIPFCTFGSGGKETGAKSLDEVTRTPLNYDVLFGIRNARIANAAAEVEYFLKSNGLLEGEYEQKPDFSASESVGVAESEIFQKACGDYPMLHAAPTAFGKRAVSAGTEYLFEALDSAQSGTQSIKVLVFVPNDTTLLPEFTEVIR